MKCQKKWQPFFFFFLRSAKGYFSGYSDEECSMDRTNSVSDVSVLQSVDWEQGLILPALLERWNPLLTRCVCRGSGLRWTAARALQQLCNSTGRAGAACAELRVKNCLVWTYVFLNMTYLCLTFFFQHGKEEALFQWYISVAYAMALFHRCYHHQHVTKILIFFLWLLTRSLNLSLLFKEICRGNPYSYAIFGWSQHCATLLLHIHLSL